MNISLKYARVLALMSFLFPLGVLGQDIERFLQYASPSFDKTSVNFMQNLMDAYSIKYAETIEGYIGYGAVSITKTQIYADRKVIQRTITTGESTDYDPQTRSIKNGKEIINEVFTPQRVYKYYAFRKATPDEKAFYSGFLSGGGRYAKHWRENLLPAEAESLKILSEKFSAQESRFKISADFIKAAQYQEMYKQLSHFMAGGHGEEVNLDCEDYNLVLKMNDNKLIEKIVVTRKAPSVVEFVYNKFSAEVKPLPDYELNNIEDVIYDETVIDKDKGVFGFEFVQEDGKYLLVPTEKWAVYLYQNELYKPHLLQSVSSINGIPAISFNMELLGKLLQESQELKIAFENNPNNFIVTFRKLKPREIFLIENAKSAEFPAADFFH